ncbi:MAG: hypothetical protein QOI22_247 [Verrucomicrobiota bacterium]
MLEPTITQNGALYLIQHSVGQFYEAPRHRWFGRSLAKLPMVPRHLVGQPLEVQRLHLGER